MGGYGACWIWEHIGRYKGDMAGYLWIWEDICGHGMRWVLLDMGGYWWKWEDIGGFS